MITDLWRPLAWCGPRCLPSRSEQAGGLRQAGRLLAATAVMSVGVLVPGQAQRVARALLRSLGIRWHVLGARPQPGALLVGNHVSWLDILLMLALGSSVRSVSKIEVGRWPVVGRIARRRRAIFVDRSRPRTLPGTVAEVAAALRAGETVQVFPEGTTTCGAHPVRWRSAFFQAAIDAGAPVQRFDLIFSSPAAAFIGDEDLVRSLRRVVSQRRLTVTVLMDEPRLLGGSRRELARLMEGATSSQKAFRQGTAVGEAQRVR